MHSVYLQLAASALRQQSTGCDCVGQASQQEWQPVMAEPPLMCWDCCGLSVLMVALRNSSFFVLFFFILVVLV
jgi:hypothetical protein